MAFLLLLVSSLASQGQESIRLSGLVIDIEKSNPIPFAYVTLNGVALGTVTNGEGRFAITIPLQYVNDELLFSYVGYEKKIISIQSLRNRDKIIIKLKPDVKMLNEVVITPRKSMSPKALLRKVIRKIPDNYGNTAVLMNAYYRETIRENGAYIKYADAVCQYHYAPYQNKKYKWKDYGNVWVGASGSLSNYNTYAGSRLHRFHFAHRTLKEDQLKVIDSRSSYDLTKTRMHANIEGGPLGLLGRDRIKFQDSFLGNKMFKRFDYELGEVQGENGEWLYLITFKTKITSEKLDALESKKNNKQWRAANTNKLLKGKVYINQDDLAIVKYECSVPNNLKKYFCGFTAMAIKHFDYKLEAEYGKIKDRYFLKRLRHEDEFIYKDTITNTTTPYAAVAEVVIKNIQRDSVIKFKRDEVFANINSNQLYDLPLEYNNEFWETYLAENPTAAIPNDIRADMESLKPLEKQFVDKHKRDENIVPPIAQKKSEKTRIHGETLIDDYAWLKDTRSASSNNEVMDYIEAENKYADNHFIPLRKVQRDLFEELTSRVEKNYESLPTRENGYEYFTTYSSEDEYPIYYRKREGKEEKEVLLDVNKLAEGKEYYSAGGINVSPDTKIMAFYENTTGSDKATLKFKNLSTNVPLTDSLLNTAGIVWVDNGTVLYIEQEPRTNRTFKVKRHVLGTLQKADELVYEEKDKTFSVSLYKSRSKQFIYLSTSSSTSSEVRFLRVDRPDDDFKLIAPREENHLYSISDYKTKFFKYTNKDALNFKILQTDTAVEMSGKWKKHIPHNQEVLINGFLKFDNYTVIREKAEAQNKIKIIENATGNEHYIKFKQDVYNVGFGYNPDTNTDTLQIRFQSMKTPVTTFNYHMGTKKKRLVKIQKVPNMPFSKFIDVKRVWAEAKDGTKIPITLVYRRWSAGKKAKNKRLYLTSYGSYGSGMDVYFNHTVFSLLDRGFVYAIAHIRGGDDMGRQWYEEGKLLEKKNTFTDFIDCAEYLIAENYATKGEIVAEGASAGGLLMGVVANIRPDLFKLIILEKPFVDVINTMLDTKLPLTTLEYDEWGDPGNKRYYQYMKSYSPYDNVIAQEYPNMLFITGLNDTRVGYWEPAKMVAKLRANKTDDNLLLLKTDLSSGHGGASGRYSWYKNLAYKYAIIFDVFAKSVKLKVSP
ncbi:MAG: prolyl oligopeptidase family serine peptidase [Bacteroidota bacterium]